MATRVQDAGSGNALRLHFATVLNLTDGADVNVNGITVGHVRSVRLASDSAEVTVAFDSDVRIAADAHAAIRQSTVLGDSFVAIESDPTSSAQARAESIPLSQTTAPPPLENTLAVLANFVSGGSVQNAQDVLRMVNKSLPVHTQTQRVASIVAVDSQDLAARTAGIDEMLRALNASATAIDTRAEQISDMLSAEGMHYWSQLSLGLEQVGVVLPSVGSVFEGGYWLLPMLQAVRGSIHTVREGIDAVGSNSQLITTFLSDNLFPFIQRPDLTIVSAKSAQGRDVLATAERVLRMLGATR